MVVTKQAEKTEYNKHDEPFPTNFMDWMSRFTSHIYGHKTYFSLDDMKLILADRFSKAESHIKISLSWATYPINLDGLVINSLKKAAEKGVDIKIISGPDIDYQNREMMRLIDSQAVKYYPISFGPVRGEVIVDYDFYMAVDPYNPLKKNRRVFFVHEGDEGAICLAGDKNEALERKILNKTPIQSVSKYRARQQN